MGRILIIGAGGMLGHKLCQLLTSHEIVGTVRKDKDYYKGYSEVFANTSLIEHVDVLDTVRLQSTIKDIAPDVTINCVGVIKQLKEAKDPVVSIKINALLPHQIANICEESGSRLIQISTDCVFDGMKGSYSETDHPNAADIYGRTKCLGEVTDRDHCITLRTSIVGRELNTTSGLVEWFLSNKGKKVKGFQKAIYTGFTTIALCNIINELIENCPDLSGLYQVSSEPINKYDFICKLRDAMNLDIEIEPETDFFMDRSLLCDRFKEETQFIPPSWDEMINQLATDPTPYDKWRTQ